MGILSITKTTKTILVQKHEIIPKTKIWTIVGGGEKYDQCGEFSWKGCLNTSAHNPHFNNSGILQKGGQAFVKGYKSSCDRAECPECFERWAGKQAHRSALRIKSYKAGFRKPIHITISVPEKDYNKCDDEFLYKEVRSTAYKLALQAGFKGGNLVFHPFRKDDRGWYYSPHFHAVGYGWITQTKEIYEKTGYIVKNLLVRKSTLGTIFYQLSHAGVSLLKVKGKKYGYNTITWFGELSYNKLKFVPEKPEPEKCPHCKEDLILLSFVGMDRPPPEEESEFMDDAGRWLQKGGFYNFD